jgi:arylsulfatase A-like enzyme
MTPEELPNILLLHADQHRYDCLGAYGNSQIHTPHIDGIARDGRIFTNSFSSYPVCTPSRYSLLCGQYVRQHGGWNNRCTLAPGIPTFPRIMGDAGYKTAAIGKMHFTPTYLDVGFQEMFLAEQDGPGRYDDDYHRRLMTHNLCDKVDLMDQVREYRQHATPDYWEHFGAVPSDLDEQFYSTTWIAEKALERLESWHNGGNLLMVGFIKPHHPFDPPIPWHKMYTPDDIPLLPGWIDKPLERDINRNKGYFPHVSLTEQKLRRIMAYYYATITHIDHQIGRFVDCLKKQGLYKNTLIVYTSDHGDYMGFHHLILKGNYMYDPLIKVPLIIKFPGNALAGTISTHLVSNLDVAPTLLRGVGIQPPATMQGLDLRNPRAHRDVIFAEGWAGNEIMARSKTHKLLFYSESERNQFYYLDNDPYELENRISESAVAPELLLLREAMMEWALFSAHSHTYVDPKAPIIHGENVPVQDDTHVQDTVSYFRGKMRSFTGPD